MAKHRSAKGEMVDFDLIKIKQEIASSPAPQDVKIRQDFIEKRLRRRLNKVAPPAPKIESGEDPKMPATETLSEEAKLIDAPEEEVKEVEVKKPTTRQKARPPKKTTT